MKIRRDSFSELCKQEDNRVTFLKHCKKKSTQNFVTPSKNIFQNEREGRDFFRPIKTEKFITIKSVLLKMLKEFLQAE